MPDLSLSSLLAPERVRIGVRAATKADVLETVVGLVSDAPGVADADRLLRDVQAREETLSTGVGGGLALPHARSTAVRSTVAALMTLAEPVEYDAFDGAPVSLVVFLAGPEGDPGAHVRLLGRVSRLLVNPALRVRLATAETPEALLALLADAEAA